MIFLTVGNFLKESEVANYYNISGHQIDSLKSVVGVKEICSYSNHLNSEEKYLEIEYCSAKIEEDDVEKYLDVLEKKGFSLSLEDGVYQLIKNFEDDNINIVISIYLNNDSYIFRYNVE